MRILPCKNLKTSSINNRHTIEMQKTTNPENTTVTYALPPDRIHKMHDDRAYTLVLLAHRLYELRRKDKVRQSAVETMTTPPICISNIDF